MTSPRCHSGYGGGTEYGRGDSIDQAALNHDKTIVKEKLLELRVFFLFVVRVYLQLVVIVYSFLLLYCLLSFWCHHRCVMLRNLSSFLV